MNIIALIDLIAFLFIFCSSTVFIIQSIKRENPAACAPRNTGLLFIAACFYLFLFIKWNWNSAFFGEAENFISVLLPTFWGIFFYGMHQKFILNDLAESEKTHREFVENNPVGICRLNIDKQGRFLYANQAMAEIFGYDSVKEFTNVNETSLYQNQADRQLILQKLKDTGLVDYHEVPAKRKDGSHIEIVLTLRLLENNQSESHIVEGIVRDITKRKQAERSLQRSEELHRVAQRIAKLGHWEVTSDNKMISWSDEMYQICEFDPSKYDGSLDKIFDSIHPDDRGSFHGALGNLFTNHERLDNIHRLVFENDRIKYVHIQGEAIYNQDGQIHQIVGTLQDVTQVKTAELEQKRFESRLARVQKLEAIGTLAGGIAHDFNNILSGVIGYTQLAAYEVEKDSPTAKKLDMVLQAGLRAKDLVGNILAFSRDSEHAFTSIQVESIIREAVKLLRATIPSTINIKWELDEKCCPILADPTQIHQIIMNLCTNAYHAIDPEPGEITVDLKQIELTANDLRDGIKTKPGPHIHLQVKDNGSGIEQQVINKIFDPYFTTKERGNGTGLGLSVVHGIVKEHGGKISVYSEKGRGTVFHIFLPCITENQAEESTNQTQLQGGKEHIMVVDDELFIADMLREMLTGLGYRITSFDAAEDALNYFEAGIDLPDLLITDMTMPEITGDILAEQILENYPDFPIIIHTGYNDRLDEDRAREIGIRAYLSKPITEEVLACSIRKILD